MSYITLDFVDKAKAWVMELLDRELPRECVFHNSDHTNDVYKNSQIIGEAIRLSPQDLNCLALGAIFHDTGYIKDYDNHEVLSASIARDYLEDRNIDEEIVSQVERAILATKVPQQPQDLISMALCDADLMYLTQSEYFERVKPLSQEWKLVGRSDLSEKDFHKQSIVFFKKHKYHTEYGRKVLEPKKQLTLEKIKERIIASE